jgi:dihydroxyacetone kinase-like predicted kinase
MRKFILTEVFGDTVRIKILELLLENVLKKEIEWEHISKIAKEAGISTSSSKRVIDSLIQEKIVDVKPIKTHAKNPKKNIRLNLDNKVVSELVFFYRKVRAFK